MTLELILGVALLAALFYAIINHNNARAARREKLTAANKLIEREGKFEAVRQEVGQLKEKLNAKEKALEELREQARKKLRKEATKIEIAAAEVTGEAEGEVERLRKALKTVEFQLSQVAKEAKEAFDAERVQTERDTKEQIGSLKEQVKQLKEELSGRGDQKKRTAKMAGVMIELENLSEDVVGEFARLARKGQQFEKMHAVAQGKYQLAQERFNELQKRYFAVCRELALAVGKPNDVADVEARDAAEQLVAAADAQTSEIEKQ